MKKDEAMDRIDRAGFAINDLNARAWKTALDPGSHGWAASLLSVASIPVLSAASLGQLVTRTVVKQVDPKTFERITTLTDESPPKP